MTAIPILILFCAAAWSLGPLVKDSSGQPFRFTALNTDISRLNYGSVALADVNGDGRLDVLFTGNRESAQPFGPMSGVAVNVSNPTSGTAPVPFEITSLSTQAWLGKASWNDVDLDGDLDFVLTGTQSESDPYASMSVLYRNDGGWHAEDVGLVGVHAGVVRWADTDNDGDSDLLLMGRTTDNTYSVRLYRNDDGQAFTEVQTPFPQVAFGDAAWGDYDNDTDLDLVISGVLKTGEFVTALFRNEGDFGFSLIPAPLPKLGFSALAWGDYDADGRLDLAVSGAQIGSVEPFRGVTKIFRHHAGGWSELPFEIVGTYYGDLSWADNDLDGDLDLFVMGQTAVSGSVVGLIYENADGAFHAVTGLVGPANSTAEWGDFDGDRDVDVMVSGSFLGFPVTKLYRNDSRLVNVAPSAPTGLDAVVEGGSVLLSWNAAEDVETASTGLTYAVRVGTVPGGSDVMSAYASAESGHRTLPGFGNAGTNLRWRLKGLASGVYYWSVQAIDASLIGSSFAQESQFTITTGGKITTGADSPNELPSELMLSPVYPNPLRDRATVQFELPAGMNVRLKVFDVLGKEVAMLVDDFQSAGIHRVEWNGKTSAGIEVGAGVYFLQMHAGTSVMTRQVVVLK